MCMLPYPMKHDFLNKRGSIIITTHETMSYLLRKVTTETQ